MNRQPDSEQQDLSPPETSGWGLSFWLALLVHLALVVALSLGISWHHEATTAAIQAELWAAVPVEAAPPAPEVASETPPEPQPEVTPPPPPVPPAPQPVVKPAPPMPKAAPTPQVDAQIALEKERKLKEKEKEKKLKEEKLKEQKLAQEKREQELKDQKAKEAKEKAAKEQAAKEQAKQQAKEDERKAEALRQENLKRMQKLAGSASSPSVSGNGAPGSAGQATRSAGPSGSYAGKVKQRVQPHITFDAKDTPGNPEAEVAVWTSPDGTITRTKLTKSSGVPAWDDAVLRALDKTQTLPRDEDGRVPSSMILVFRPKD